MRHYWPPACNKDHNTSCFFTYWGCIWDFLHANTSKPPNSTLEAQKLRKQGKTQNQGLHVGIGDPWGIPLHILEDRTKLIPLRWLMEKILLKASGVECSLGWKGCLPDAEKKGKRKVVSDLRVARSWVWFGGNKWKRKREEALNIIAVGEGV